MAEKPLKVGILDCARYSDFESWILRAPEHPRAVRLSYRLDNLDEAEKCDGILLSGGHDIHPRRYGKPELYGKLDPGYVDEARDDFEWRVLERVLTSGKPIMGICRGLELMNVYLGGSLIYDIPELTGLTAHGIKEGGDQRHGVEIQEGSLIHAATGARSGEVSSAHHQAVERLADELIVTAHAEPSIVEGLQWKNPEGKPWMLLVQWHPERMDDQDNPLASNLRTAFLKELLR